MARGKGKGQRFDYLFKKLDLYTSIASALLDNERLELLNKLRLETTEKACFSDYEKHDKETLLNQCDWWIRFYE